MPAADDAQAKGDWLKQADEKMKAIASRKDNREVCKDLFPSSGRQSFWLMGALFPLSLSPFENKTQAWTLIDSAFRFAFGTNANMKGAPHNPLQQDLTRVEEAYGLTLLEYFAKGKELLCIL